MRHSIIPGYKIIIKTDPNPDLGAHSIIVFIKLYIIRQESCLIH